MENNIFNQLANQYDTNERKELARIIVDAIRPELVDCKNKTLLDYGCGTGLVGLEFCSQVDRLFLMDSSASMLEVVQEKIVQSKIENAEIVYDDFIKSSSNVRADFIIASLVLLHVPDVSRLLRGFYKALNPNGKLIIVDFDKNESVSHPNVHSGFTRDDIESLLNDSGFHAVKIKTFYHGKRIFMNQDASLFICTCSVC
ncbi:class I SAM-dependent DNA methyltransferase [Leptospira barantonii]|uniref:Class I SAM-dependent methyltransferase n=1 Tax=Leptospira barantonii TaxID=2023184 RepID=A0ABX4NMK6_9LEPT|nr:class I SAM-dependent methyltransferase [Leptospira barantonii]PJZ58061.1 hypothetical protein CH367_06630 [Leptospira barantonii]